MIGLTWEFIWIVVRISLVVTIGVELVIFFLTSLLNWVKKV